MSGFDGGIESLHHPCELAFRFESRIFVEVERAHRPPSFWYAQRLEEIFELEPGKNGVFTHEVSDLTRPTSRVETGNSETSLLSYLEALDQAFGSYIERAGEQIVLRGDARFRGIEDIAADEQRAYDREHSK